MDVAPADVNPRDLVKRDDVRKVLIKDLGENSVLESFVIKDFTDVGDNYTCIVTRVEVVYTNDGKTYNTSYVAKVNPGVGSFFTTISENMFGKEIGFYSEILPLINRELALVGEKNLRVPKYFHAVTEKSGEVIYMEDLHRNGFRMFDRMKGMDKFHTLLVLEELARLHAASVLLFSRDEYKGVDILEKHTILKDKLQVFQDKKKSKQMESVFEQMVENNAKMVEALGGYQHVVDFFRGLKGNEAIERYSRLYVCEAPFTMIVHGDCWNNNFLFRYDADGKPVECRLVDWQIVRLASPALDLNYMLYCSLDGQVRSQELTSFFAVYYSSFVSVLAMAGVCPKFTLSKFKEEFYSKNLFGCVSSMILIPIVLRDEVDSPAVEKAEGKDLKEQMADLQTKLFSTVHKNPLLKTRLLSMLDEMNANGLFS